MMKSLKSFVLTGAALVVLGQGAAEAQQLAPIRIAVDLGVAFRSSDDYGHERLHEGVVEDPTDNTWSDFETYPCRLQLVHLGVEPEFELCRIVSAQAGVRFTYANAKLGRRFDDYTLYWRVAENDEQTFLVRLCKMRQESYYVGIPVSLRLVPCGLDETSVFIRVGASFNWRTGCRNMAYAKHQSMEMAEKDIESQMGKPDNFQIPLWASVGVQFGHSHNACLELMLPYTLRHAQPSSIITYHGTAVGLQFSYRIPTYFGE